MKKICPSCGGSGQLSFFQGVSRFLLTTDECPECSGTGHIIEKKPGESQHNQNNARNRKKKKKSRG